MNIAVPSRHRRLLLLCGLSAALHLLLIELVARHGVTVSPTPPARPAVLVLRLTHAGPVAAVAPARTPSPSAAPAPAPVPAPAPAPAPALAPTPARPSVPVPASAAPPADAPIRTPEVSDAQGAGEAGAESQDTPQRYRVRMPAAVRLTYTLMRRDSSGRAAPAHTAVLDWRTDGARYELRMDGVLGQLSSSGSDGDNGIEPANAVDETGGRHLVTSFDRGRGRVRLADGSEVGAIPGIQDRASLLMQLVGIGLARPDQVRDVVRIAVAGVAGARVERYQVMGQEQVDTALGPLSAWRLAQVVAPGESRLDVWLAPSRDWLPVMLRVTEGDGSSSTQVLARTEPGTAP